MMETDCSTYLTRVRAGYTIDGHGNDDEAWDDPWLFFAGNVDISLKLDQMFLHIY